MHKIEPCCCQSILPFPAHFSEEQVRFILAKEIYAFGLFPALEYPIPTGGYLDILIFNRTRTTAIAIIETKPRLNQDNTPSHKQRYLYASFGLPVYLVCGLASIPHFTSQHLPLLESEYASTYSKFSPAPYSALHPQTRLIVSNKSFRRQSRISKLRSLAKERLALRKLDKNFIRDKFPHLTFK